MFCDNNMNIQELLSHLLDLDIKLWLDGELLRYNAPKGAMTPELQTELSSRKIELIAYLKRLDKLVTNTDSSQPQVDSGPVQLIPLLMMDYVYKQPQAWWRMIEVLVELPDALGQAHIMEAVKYLAAYHDGLRLRLVKKDDTHCMFIAPSDEKVFLARDLSKLTEMEQDAAIEATIPEQWAVLDFATGPLLRVVFFDLGSQRSPRLLFLLHHFAADGYSLRILLNDFQTVCHALLVGAPVRLPPKTTSLKQWAELMYTYVQSPAGMAESEYWSRLPWDRVRPLPVDHPQVVESPAASLTGYLSTEETRVLLSSVPSSHHVHLLDVLLTACVITYIKYAQLKPLVITVLHHGRNPWLDELDLLRTVGNIYTSYPFLVDISLDLGSPQKVLELVAEQRACVPNEGSAWYWVSSYASTDAFPSLREQGDAPGNVVFNYLGQANLNSAAQPQFFREVQGRTGLAAAPQSYNVVNMAPHTCSVIIENGQLKVTWEYFSLVDDEATIDGLLQTYLAVLRELISTTTQSRGAVAVAKG